jgi:hypothetical protein
VPLPHRGTGLALKIRDDTWIVIAVKPLGNAGQIGNWVPRTACLRTTETKERQQMEG